MSGTTIDKIARGEKPATPVQKFSGFLDKLKPQMALALPRHMSADRMARLALTAYSTTPALQECTAESIAACLMTASQLGLEPGVNGHAYLIPYKDRRKGITVCTLIPGWKGLADLVARSGRATVWTGAVFAGDDFAYQLGDAPYCRHTPSDDDSATEFSHVYAIGRVRDAEMPVIEVWSRSKVVRHLSRYNKVGDRHYANANEHNLQMYGRKVALLQVLKYMPSSIELSTAVQLTTAADTGEPMIIDMAAFADPDTGELHQPPVFDYLAAMTRIAATTDREILALMADEWRDMPASPERDALVAAYADRDAELGAS